MAYLTLNKAHTHHNIMRPDGSTLRQYSRYENGLITGNHRDIPAVIADSTGFDGLGFDASVGSNDDSWHMVSVFKNNGSYINSMAVAGVIDSDHALQVARTQLDHLGGDHCTLITNGSIQFDGIDNDHAWSIDAISKLMDNPSQNKSFLPIITAPELNVEAERVTFDSVRWDSEDNLISHGGKDSRLYLDLTRADTRNELVTEFDLADALFSMDAQEAGFDALMDTKSRLPLLKDRLFKALSRAGTDDLAITNVTQTKEFKRQGVINTAFVFDLSDGQKLSIWFHKPTSTPSKLLPSDIMISWKWMLNKRDVTAALSPKQGDNVQLPSLAQKIMRVAAKNSKRFKSTQKRNAALAQELLDAQKAIEDKNATIDQLDTDIADLNTKIDAAMQAPESDTVNESGMQAGDADPVDTELNAGLTEDVTTESNEDFGTNKPASTSTNGKGVQIDSDDVARIPAAGIPVREALEYVKANVFKGKDDQVLMYVTDRNTGEIKESKLVKASSQSAQTRWSNKFIYDDTTGSVYNQSIPKSNTNAATLLEDLGYTVDYSDPDNFIDDQFKVGSAYRFIDPNDADDTGSVYQFKSWEGIKRGNDEPVLSFSSFSGATGKSFKLSEMQQLVANGGAVLVTDAEADAAKDFETEKPVSVYVNSKGRELVAVTYSYGRYDLKGKGFSSGADDEAGVLKQLRSIRKDNPSMKLKEGKEFFPAGDDGKDYPPVERDSDGNYIAYMNSKKKDNWEAALQSDGGFIVYANNAQTRAYGNSTPRFIDNVEDLLKTYPAYRGIKPLIAEDLKAEAEYDEYDDIDSSEYPALFLERNKDQLQVIGVSDDNIQVNDDGYYFVEDGVFENKTLHFTDAVCKVVDAAISIEADAVVGDFTATAYQDSMFDNLSSQSKPTYGITVQISKDGVNLRADIDKDGVCKILQGASGQEVIATIKHVFTDNTGEYKTAIEDALKTQVDENMGKKAADEPAQTDFNAKMDEQQRLNQEAKARLNLTAASNDKAGTNVGDIVDLEGKRSTKVYITQLGKDRVHFGAKYRNDSYTSDMTYAEFEAAIERAKQGANTPAKEYPLSDFLLEKLTTKMAQLNGFYEQNGRAPSIDSSNKLESAFGRSIERIRVENPIAAKPYDTYGLISGDLVPLPTTDAPEELPVAPVDPVGADVPAEPVKQSDFSVGDPVVWRNENGEIKGDFRGYTDDGQKVILVANGNQMAAPANEVFIDDQPAEPEPVVEPEVVNDPEPVDTAMADRINEIEQQINAADFDPMAIDTSELIELVDQAEGNAELSAKLDAISVTLQQKMVAISMKALAGMAGGA